MRTVTTATLFAIVLLLSIAIWWVDRAPRPAVVEGTEAGNVLRGFDADTVGRIVVKRPAGEISLEKSAEGAWRLGPPANDLADPAAVAKLLDQLGHLTVLDRIPLGDLTDDGELSPAALGLTAEEVIRLELSTASGAGGETETLAFLFGKATPLADTVYARLPDAPDRPDVYVVDGNPHSLLDDPVLALRDPRLLPWQPDRVVQLTLKTARGEIEVRRKITPPVAGWTLVRPLQTRANTDLLERTLTSLATVRAESIEPAASPPGPPPNPVPDGHLVFELRSLGEENPLTVYLSPADGGKTDGTPGAGSKEPLLEAKIADRPAVFRLRSRLLAEMPESPNAFRDHSLARIPPALVFGIGIRSPDNPPVELKSTRTPDGVRWYSARNGEEEPANVARVARLIKAINEEPVVDFVSDSAARLEEFGLASPALQVAFNLFQIRPETAPDGAPAADAGKVGVEKKVLLLGSKDEYTLYANFVGEPYIYEINRSFSNYLPRHPLKWKDLRVLSFNPISLQYIERTRKGGPAIRLEYDYKRDTWTANEAGEDLTGLLDASAARQLRDTLGSLAAADWLTSLPIAYQALETPSVTFRIGVKSIDKATGDARVVTHELKFAPAGGELFYGQIDGAADAIFTLDSKTYRDLVQPLTQTRVAP